jgi:hypothetical protein
MKCFLNMRYSSFLFIIFTIFIFILLCLSSFFFFFSFSLFFFVFNFYSCAFFTQKKKVVKLQIFESTANTKTFCSKKKITCVLNDKKFILKTNGIIILLWVDALPFGKRGD